MTGKACPIASFLMGLAGQAVAFVRKAPTGWAGTFPFSKQDPEKAEAPVESQVQAKVLSRQDWQSVRAVGGEKIKNSENKLYQCKE
jgi:hypothetical protein